MKKTKKNKDENIELLYDMLSEYSTDVDNFLKAPRKAQQLLFMGVDLTGLPAEYSSYNIEPPYLPIGLTPIESILCLAYQVYTLFIGKNTQYLFCQYDIYLENNKHYIVDFYDKGSNLVIECDGHDFHEKTKEQVAYDNERELDLKMAGYNIVRFSGSQIFNEPFECAKELYDYIQKLRKEKMDELH